MKIFYLLILTSAFICCDEEVGHQNDAKMQKGLDKNSFFENMWSNLIGSGSNVAVNVSKLI